MSDTLMGRGEGPFESLRCRARTGVGVARYVRDTSYTDVGESSDVMVVTANVCMYVVSESRTRELRTRAGKRRVGERESGTGTGC